LPQYADITTRHKFHSLSAIIQLDFQAFEDEKHEDGFEVVLVGVMEKPLDTTINYHFDIKRIDTYPKKKLYIVIWITPERVPGARL
jgi:hypothetical protein